MFVFQIRNVQVVLCYENDNINSRPEIHYNHFIFGMVIPLDMFPDRSPSFCPNCKFLILSIELVFLA